MANSTRITNSPSDAENGCIRFVCSIKEIQVEILVLREKGCPLVDFADCEGLLIRREMVEEAGNPASSRKVYYTTFFIASGILKLGERSEASRCISLCAHNHQSDINIYQITSIVTF